MPALRSILLAVTVLFFVTGHFGCANRVALREGDNDPRFLIAQIDPGEQLPLLHFLEENHPLAVGALQEQLHDRAGIPSQWFSPTEIDIWSHPLTIALAREQDFRSAGEGTTSASEKLKTLADAYFRVAMAGYQRDASSTVYEVSEHAKLLHSQTVAQLLRTGGAAYLPVASRQLGDIAFESIRFDDATHYYIAALGLLPKPQPSLWVLLCKAYQLNLHFPQARECIQNVRKETIPGDERHFVAKKVAEFESLQVAADLLWGDTEFYRDRLNLQAELLLRLGRYRQTSTLASKLSTQSPESPAPRLVLAAIAIYEGKLEEAANHLNAALHSPKRPRHTLDLAVTIWSLRWMREIQAAMANRTEIALRQRLWHSALYDEWQSTLLPALQKESPDRAKYSPLNHEIGKACYGGASGPRDLKKYEKAAQLYERHPKEDAYAVLVASTAADTVIPPKDSLETLAQIASSGELTKSSRSMALTSLAVSLLHHVTVASFDIEAVLENLPPGDDVSTVLARGNFLAILAHRMNSLALWERAAAEYKRGLHHSEQLEYVVLVNNYAVALARTRKLAEASALLHWDYEKVRPHTYMRLNAAILKAQTDQAQGLQDLLSFFRDTKLSLNQRFLAASWFLGLGGARLVDSEHGSELVKSLAGSEPQTIQNLYYFQEGALVQYNCGSVLHVESVHEKNEVSFWATRRIWLGFPPAMGNDALHAALRQLESPSPPLH